MGGAAVNPRARELIDAGASDAEVADALGVSSRTVRRWRAGAGVASRWTPTPPAHGTRSRYNRGCRCDRCTAENARYAAQNRAAYRRARSRPTVALTRGPGAVS